VVVPPWKDGDLEAMIKRTKRGAAIKSVMLVELFLNSSAMRKNENSGSFVSFL
jgi:hypothetical protein